MPSALFSLPNSWRIAFWIAFALAAIALAAGAGG